MKQKTLLLAVLAIGLSASAFAGSGNGKGLISSYQKSTDQKVYQLTTEKPTGPSEFTVQKHAHERSMPSPNATQSIKENRATKNQTRVSESTKATR